MKICVSALLIFVFPAWASAAIGISQPIIQGHVDPLNFGQSFTASEDAELTGIRLSVVASFGGSDFTLRLYDFDRSTLTLSPTVLASGTVTESQLSTSPAWIEVPLDAGFQLAQNNTYAFTILAKDPGGIATGWNNYGATQQDVYAGGEYFFGLSGTVSTNTNLKELAFETVVLPEPSGIGLMVALAFFCKRSRRSNWR